MGLFDKKLDALIVDIRARSECLSSFGPCERQRGGDACDTCRNSAEQNTRRNVTDAVNRAKGLLQAWGFDVLDRPE